MFYFPKNFFFKHKNHPSTSCNQFKLVQTSLQLLYNISHIFKKKKKRTCTSNTITQTTSNLFKHPLQHHNLDDSLHKRLTRIAIRVSAKVTIEIAAEGRTQKFGFVKRHTTNGAKGNFTGHVAVNQASHRGWSRRRTTDPRADLRTNTDFHGNRKQGSGR